MPEVSLEISFQTLFNTEYEKLCRLALAYMQDEQLAEDVVQETFIKIWEQKQDIITAPNARYYLAAAVRNNCISALRKLKNSQVSYTDNTPEPEPEPFFYVKPGEEQEQQRRKIADALNQLPPKCREVFLMVKLQDFSYKQAADALDVSIKTIENQMGKALRIFREITAVRSLVFVLLLINKFIIFIGVFS